MTALRVLIADDEPLARQRLEGLLASTADAEVVGTAGDGEGAVAAIRQLRPDLVFLDVQMPVLDGFGVVREVGPDAMPAVVFVTAYDRYALRAFEVHALDYLLKPFDDARFEQALARARERIRRDRLDGLCDRLRDLLGTPEETAPAPAPQRLAIRSAGRVVLVDTADLDWIEGAGSYVRLHSGGRSYLLRQTLKQLEETLDEGRFLRIHRSFIVNLERIQELRPAAHGESRVILRDGTELKLSRGYRDRVSRLLGG